MRTSRQGLNHFLGLSPRSSSHPTAHHPCATVNSVDDRFLPPSDLTPILPGSLKFSCFVNGVPVAYHLCVRLNDNGAAYVGFGFNIFASFITNAILSSGHLHNALLVGTVHSTPFNHSLPYTELAFIGRNQHTVFLPMVYGLELGMIDETAEFLSKKEYITGTQHEQIPASINVMQENMAPFAKHHGMIAIEFENIPQGFTLCDKSG